MCADAEKGPGSHANIGLLLCSASLSEFAFPTAFPRHAAIETPHKLGAEKIGRMLRIRPQK